MNDVLEWVEKAAIENLRYHLASTDTLAKEANLTLTILLAALSAAFSYVLANPTLRAAAIVMTLYLFGLCLLLVSKCLMIEEVPSPTNEPRNLLQDGYELDALARAELKNIQVRIDQAALRNTNTALWLNRVRIGAVLTPVVFVVSAFAAAVYCRGG